MPKLNIDYDLGILDRAVKGANIERLGLESQILGEAFRGLPEEKEYLRRSRALSLGKAQQEVETGGMALDLAKKTSHMNRVNLIMEHINKLLPRMDYQAYTTGGRDYLVKSATDLGVETGIENVLPTSDRFSAMALSQGTMPEEFFKDYVNKLTTSFSEQTARITAEARKIPKAPTLDWEYKNIGGAPHKRQKQWNPGTGRWESVGDWIRMEKPEGGKPEKYTMAQRLDDTRQYYAAKATAMKDPMGYGVLREYRKEYSQLIKNMDKDLRAIRNGSLASWETKIQPTNIKKLIGTKGGKPVYDIGNGNWQIGD